MLAGFAEDGAVNQTDGIECFRVKELRPGRAFLTISGEKTENRGSCSKAELPT